MNNGRSRINKEYHLGHNTAAKIHYKDGESLRRILDETVHAGVLEAITLTDEGGLNISWTAGEIYTPAGVIQETDASAGAQACTDNAVNYLVWTAGSTLTLRTTRADPSTEVQVAHIQCQDGDIWHLHEEPLVLAIVPAIQEGLHAVGAVLVESGIIVTEDADATNDLDVAVSAGTYWLDVHNEHAVAQYDTRTADTLIRCYIDGAGPETWDFTAAQHSIDIANWNNGIALVGVTNNKYYKGLFVVSADNVFWIYAQEQHNTIAQAIEADLPSIPAGLKLFPRSVAYIYKGGETAFEASTTNRWIDVRPRIGITPPGSLIGAVVEGPTVSTDNAAVRFDGTGGSLIQNSGVIIDDTDNVSTPGNVGIGTNSPAVNLQLGDVGGGHKQITIHADGDALTLKQDVAGDDTYQTWYTAGGVRRGYFGYAQGSSDVLTLGNETGGHIRILGIDEDDVGIEDGKFLLLLNDPDTTANKQKGIAFGRANDKIIAGIEPNIPVGGGGHLDFYTAASDDSPSLAMRIDKDGVLSIDNIQELTAAAGVTIDGVLIKDSNVSGMESLLLADNKPLKFGTGDDARIQWDEGTQDSLQIGTNVGFAGGSGYVSIMDRNDLGQANREPAASSADPVLRVFSADATQALDYLDLFHNQTDACMRWGNGNLKILDVNDNEALELADVASAVNHVKLTNAATTDPAILEATGGDANVDLSVQTKGTGLVNIESGTIIDVTGTEAFLVRQNADAANVFVVDTTNKSVAINAAATTAAVLEIHGTTPSMGQYRYTGASATEGAGLGINKARGTQAVPTVVVDGDVLGNITFRGYSGAASAFRAAARIRCYVDGVPDSGGDTTDMPGRLEFLTTPDGSATLSTRFTIFSGGNSRIVGTNHLEFNDANHYIWQDGTNLRVASLGDTFLESSGGRLGPSGAAERFGWDAIGISFFGNTPMAQPDYTTANVTPDRSFDADTVAVAELADIVGTLIADLIDYGLLQ